MTTPSEVGSSHLAWSRSSVPRGRGSGPTLAQLNGILNVPLQHLRPTCPHQPRITNGIVRLGTR